MHPAIGSCAPAFTLFDQNGKMRRLKDFRDSWVLLYFYPKDDTPGCTKEACGFRDAWQKLKEANCVVIGISADDQDSHAAFSQKYDLPFSLLADPEKKAIHAYGAWKEKQFMGKKFMGIARVSFLIDPRGDIAKVYEKVDTKTHAQEVLTDIEERTP